MYSLDPPADGTTSWALSGRAATSGNGGGSGSAAGAIGRAADDAKESEHGRGAVESGKPSAGGAEGTGSGADEGEAARCAGRGATSIWDAADEVDAEDDEEEPKPASPSKPLLTGQVKGNLGG